MDLQISQRLPGLELNDATLARLSHSLEALPAEAILRWAAQQFAPRITFATGFGVEGCVLLDLIGRHRAPIDVFTLDTGLFFPETYELWRMLGPPHRPTARGRSP